MYFQSLCDFLHVTLLFILLFSNYFMTVHTHFFLLYLFKVFFSAWNTFLCTFSLLWLHESNLKLTVYLHTWCWLAQAWRQRPRAVSLYVVAFLRVGGARKLCLALCVCLKHFFKKSFLGFYVEIHIFPTLDAICNIYLNWTSINKTQPSKIETKTWPIQGTKKGQLDDPILHVFQIKKPQKSRSAALSFF